MNKNKNDVIVQHLTQMISNHDYSFEPSLAQFMLNSLGKEFLMTLNVKSGEVCNLSSYSSLYGCIKRKFYQMDCNIYPDSFYKSQNNFGESYKKSMTEKITSDKINFEQWTNLLNQISLDLTKDDSCSLSSWKEKNQVSYKLWFSLRDPIQWARNYINEPDKWNLMPAEEKYLAKQLVFSSFKFNLSEMEYYHQHEEISLLLNVFLRHENTLKKNLFASDSSLTNQDWVDKIFKSSNMKDLIEQGKLGDVSQIFDHDSLKSVVKTSNLKINVDNYPEMLANLLPIAEPEKWIRAFSVKDNFNINTFFDNKFIRGYGVSLTKDLKSYKSTYGNAQKALEREISYLSDFLTTKHIKEEDLINFWNKVIKIKDLNLFKTCAKYISLPSTNDLPQSKNFYNVYNISFIEVFNSNSYEKHSLKELYLTERLEHSLQEKNEPVTRKIKI